MKFLIIFGKSVLSFVLIVIGVGLLLQMPFYAGPISYLDGAGGNYFETYYLFPFFINVVLMHLISIPLVFLGFRYLWNNKIALVILSLAPVAFADTITYFSTYQIKFQVKDVVPLYFGKSGYVKASLAKGDFVLSEFKSGGLSQNERAILCKVDDYYEVGQLAGRYAEGYEKVDAPIFLPDHTAVVGEPRPVVSYSQLVEAVKSSPQLCE